jgi:hypothetical protein
MSCRRQRIVSIEPILTHEAARKIVRLERQAGGSTSIGHMKLQQKFHDAGAVG